jgi:hypothetical protein
MRTDERERPQFRTGSTPGEEAFYNTSSISGSTGRSRHLARRRPTPSAEREGVFCKYFAIQTAQ